MTDPKLSPWFDWPVKPTLPGWYDTRMLWFGTMREARLWWNGTDFWDSDDCGPGYQWWCGPGDHWRGLAERPE